MSPAKICPACGKEFDASDRFCPTDGAVLRSAEASGDLVGEIIAERYHVVARLGAGGMGQVYLAEHVRMGRKSAVKVMNPSLARDADAISRFNREAANASRISHPNVASIYDFGETTDGLIYLAMEFVEGESLTALIERQGTLPPARAAAIVRQTGDALAAAHELGMVHRDLKPDNIMIARGREGTDLVKVVDFGIAKAAGTDAQKVTRTGLIVGTPEYMSPEQLSGDPLDARSDVYSLGLVAFTMLTGAPPFPSDTAQESMIMRLTERPRSLAEMRPDIAWPAQVQQVMDRALQRDANSRYASAAEFGRDLERALLAMAQDGVNDGATRPLATPLPQARVAPESAETTIVPADAPVGSPARRSRRAPAVAAAGLLAVLTAGAALTMARDGNRRDAVPEPLAGVDTPSVDSMPAASAISSADPVPDDAVAAPVVASRPAAPARTVSDTDTPATGGAARERRDRTAEARRIVAVARRTVEANLAADTPDIDALQRTVVRLTFALPHLPTFADSVAARYLRAQSLGLQGDTRRSCLELGSLMDLDLPRRLRTEIGTLRATACQ